MAYSYMSNPNDARYSAATVLSLLTKTLPQRQVWNIWGKGNLKYLCSEQHYCPAMCNISPEAVFFWPTSEAGHTSTPSSGCSFKGYQQFAWIVMLLDTAAIPWAKACPIAHRWVTIPAWNYAFHRQKPDRSCDWMMPADQNSIQVVISAAKNHETNLQEARFEKRKGHTRILYDRASQCSKMFQSISSCFIMFHLSCNLICLGLGDESWSHLPLKNMKRCHVDTLSHGHRLCRDVSWLRSEWLGGLFIDGWLQVEPWIARTCQNSWRHNFAVVACLAFINIYQASPSLLL